ncbi:MAG: phosphatidylserine/phosphatidylglycerophosphate/cardiolipin synthase family protein [bacterium]
MTRLLSPPPARATPGNQVEVLVGEIAFFRRLAAAFEAARERIWLTVSFISAAFRFPDGRPLWALLHAAAERGVEVRILAWQNPGFFTQRHLFQGPNVPPLHPRWRVQGHTSPDAAHCHHEKLWIVDAGAPGAVAFVGGIVMTRADLEERARAGRREGRHDVAAEVRGPAATEVARAFLTRWHTAAADPLAPTALVAPAPREGGATVQVARTLRPGADASRPAGATDILEAWRRGIDAANHLIYMENQHPGERSLLAGLARALDRGVEVVLVVPGEPMGPIHVARQRRDPRYADVFDALADLGRHPGFTLAALVQPPREHIYVHAKLTLIDGCWLSLGSANFVDLSLEADHTEQNLIIWDAGVAARTQAALWAGHGVPPGARPGPVAQANAARWRAGEPGSGLIALDPARYGAEAGAAALWGSK